MASNVFRLTTIRPPQRIPADKSPAKALHAYSASDSETPFYRTLRQVHGTEGSREEMEYRAEQYIKSAEFVSSLNDPSLPLGAQFSRFGSWLMSTESPIKLEDMKNAVKRIFKFDASHIVGIEHYKQLRRRLGDSLLAWTIYRTEHKHIGPQLMRTIRLCGLLERIAANDRDLEEKGAIERGMRVSVLFSRDLFPLPDPKSDRKEQLREAYAEEKAGAEEHRKKVLNQVKYLAVLRLAAEELTRAYDADLVDRHIESARTPLVWDSESLEADEVPGPPVIRAKVQHRGFLSRKRTETLSDNTKLLLRQLDVPFEHVDVVNSVMLIEKETAKTAAQLFDSKTISPLVKNGNPYVFTNNGGPSLSILDGLSTPGRIDVGIPEDVVLDTPSVPETVTAVRILGVADLEVVRQELVKYEPGEVAHIENVLKGEFKERKHRRTRRTEDTILVETERIEDTERDLQSTQRFELQQETAKTISEDLSLEAGVTVSYGGPTIDVTARADFAYDRAREESSKVATSHARDITERSVARLYERMREERARRTVEEFEEINNHGVDNKAGDKHVIGIYRWVDKILQAQVLNYGRRLMLEFMVPEPAAFFRYTTSHKRPTDGTIEEPEPPMKAKWRVDKSGPFEKAKWGLEPLSPAGIEEDDYLYWVGKYQVPNVEPPPPQYRIASATFSATAQPVQIIPGNSQEPLIHATKDLAIPAGYTALTEVVQFAGRAEGRWRLTVIIGEKKTTYRGDGPTSDVLEDGSAYHEQDVLPLGIEARNWITLVMTIEVQCERTAAAFQEWQTKTYTAIMARYNELKALYEEQLRAAQVQQGISINGRNPVRNREIERTELKKAAISMLVGEDLNTKNGPFGEFDAMKKNVPPYGYPEMDFKEVVAETEIIQFFEQAFEWQHMTYIFYPYFWSRKGDWPSTIQLEDTDPLFANFLRAGAARINVPVRRGYDDLVLNYIRMKLKPKNPWPDGDPPGIDEETYLSVVEEMKEQLGLEFEKGKGTISIQNGSRVVSGTDTDFTKDHHIDREVLIHSKKYRVADVTTSTELILTEDYRGTDTFDAPYSISMYKLMGEPWEVRVPTTLVYLQEDAELPTWIQD